LRAIGAAASRESHILVLKKVAKVKNVEAAGVAPAGKDVGRRKKRARVPKVSRLQARLAGQIVDLLQHQKLAAGAHVTEEFLAEQFKVSRSPVRAALRLLAQKGVFEARSNHGYFLLRAAEAIERSALDIPVAEDDHLYDRIAADLFANQLPREFRESDLIQRYGARRASLVRVLQKMFEEGLVQRKSGHGWAFAPSYTSVEGNFQSYRFRIIIEPAGLLEPTFRADKVRLQAVRRSHSRLLEGAVNNVLGAGWFNINAEFHQMLADFSGNHLIQQAIQQQNRLRRLSEYRAVPSHERIMQSLEEHFRIMDAVEEGDLEWASALLRHHLMGASRLKIAWLESARGKSAGE
jgi:DNA-binding GntR family transcriptional regulator